MAGKTYEADYVVVGTGAVGMAFVDVMLAEDKDATIIMVDRHHMPGGHWNDAYPFVTLHQPSAFYGVSSRELGTGKLDEVGLNKGMFELASGAEVSGYFDSVMRQTFLPTGRVQYFSMCDYAEGGTVTPLMGGDAFTVKAKKKVVDATYFQTSVPSTHTPSYTVADDVTRVPLNELPKLKEKPDHYCIVGGGKTGIDAIIWLLNAGVSEDAISWIMPRDAWLVDRMNTQPHMDFFEHAIGNQMRLMEAVAAATSVDDMFDRLEEGGCLVRIDTDVKPSMYHGATISQDELAQLRRVKNVIRKGRVSHIDAETIHLAEGDVAAKPNTLYVDCSARAVPVTEQYPVFEGDKITIQTVRTIQPVFSGAMVAYVEANYDDEAHKNTLCQVVPLPNHDTDWIITQMGLMMNQFTWSQDPKLKAWISANRLDGFSKIIEAVDPEDGAKVAILKRLRAAAMPAMANLQKFAADVADRDAA